ncbi:MAG: DUF2249 domain-containing protein [Pseudomonadales bacterium]|nr:DUF2249 domain-containing protein [Pseudomonadales bacterium]
MPLLLKHTLDARLMEPPEPFRQVVAKLSRMRPGEYLIMQHRRIPYPLFEFCTRQSLRWRVVPVEGREEYLITVYFPADEDELRVTGAL